MGVIRVLDKRMAELIAAGEVIDRPASVIKELVENAVDAGAKAITVEIKNGGISYMRVTDDGCGIAGDDVQNAFLRHATSKLRAPQDLQDIRTLGFRGEALASIAAMCRVEVLSRQPGAQAGVHYCIEGGEEKSRAAVGCPVGTTLVVRDIFFNTPARMKFLKRDVSEGNAVAAVCDRLAAGCPQISLRLIRDGKTVLHTPGNGRAGDAVYAVFGRDFFNTLVPVEHNHQGVAVRGFISRPSQGRGNRSMQNFYVCGRCVRSKTVMAALEEGYRTSMMKGRYPACVLDIALPPSVYDINVHPAKLEVRFADEKRIFDSVYYAVKSTLAPLDAQGVPAPLPGPAQNPFELRQSVVREGDVLRIDAATYRALAAAQFIGPGLAGQDGGAQAARPAPGAEIPRRDAAPKGALPRQRGAWNAQGAGVPESAPGEAGGTGGGFAGGLPGGMHGPPGGPGAAPAAQGEGDFAAGTADVPSEGPATRGSQAGEAGPAGRFAGARLLGELFSTYILLECGERLLLIDKHAAHERLIYERLRREEGPVRRQVLLSPVTVTLEREECAALLENGALLERLGFLAEDFGAGCVLVREIPTMLDLAEAGPAVQELAGRLAAGGRAPGVPALEDMYHTIACKAAIKAHDFSQPQELQALVQLLDEQGDVKYCPHGRPISVVVEKAQIERMFGRA